jgi:adenylate cyclase
VKSPYVFVVLLYHFCVSYKYYKLIILKPVKLKDDHTWSAEFRREVLLSERVRTILLAAVFGLVILVFSTTSFLYRDYFGRVFKSWWIIFGFIAVALLMIIRSLNISRILKKYSQKGRNIPEFLRYSNAFIEITIPSILILLFGQGIPTVFALITPVTFLYLIVIFLTTLELDFKISLFSGGLAAVQYTVIAFFFLKHSALTETYPILGFPMFYIARALIFLVAGLIAGQIAKEIERRILTSFKTINERNYIEQLFGQQVSPAIVEELLQNPEEMKSKNRQACIMFLDIRDYSKFADGKSPDEIISYQNSVFSFMIDAVTTHRGVINQFLGDGFMATFGAPVASETYCTDALNAAMEILAMLEEKCRDGQIIPTRIGIGLHAGDVVTGNVGTELRKQYSITGNTVILAARLEQLNKEFDSQLLISQEVCDKIGKVPGITPQPLGPVHVKGRSEPVLIYRIV